MLGTQPMVDREYAGVGSLRQLEAERIVALEVATDEPPPVEVDDQA
jgi:hypothetical protein